MHQLDPKAKWLFFFSSLMGVVFFVFILLMFVVPAFFSVLADAGGTNLLNPFLGNIVGFIILFILLNILVAYVWANLSYKYYKYMLAEDGFKKESGVIYKKYVTIPYDRIQNVDIYRGVLARILGLSDLHIQTAGMSYTGKYGGVSEGRLPGLSQMDAEKLRDEVIRRATHSRSKMGGGI